jgi:hypothetical protein
LVFANPTIVSVRRRGDDKAEDKQGGFQ